MYDLKESHKCGCVQEVCMRRLTMYKNSHMPELIIQIFSLTFINCASLLTWGKASRVLQYHSSKMLNPCTGS